jgi:hypothetical protein
MGGAAAVSFPAVAGADLVPRYWHWSMGGMAAGAYAGSVAHELGLGIRAPLRGRLARLRSEGALEAWDPSVPNSPGGDLVWREVLEEVRFVETLDRAGASRLGWLLVQAQEEGWRLPREVYLWAFDVARRGPEGPWLRSDSLWHWATELLLLAPCLHETSALHVWNALSAEDRVTRFNWKSRSANQRTLLEKRIRQLQDGHAPGVVFDAAAQEMGECTALLVAMLPRPYLFTRPVIRSVFQDSEHLGVISHLCLGARGELINGFRSWALDLLEMGPECLAWVLDQASPEQIAMLRQEDIVGILASEYSGLRLAGMRVLAQVREAAGSGWGSVRPLP